jgi:hypothetical protein
MVMVDVLLDTAPTTAGWSVRLQVTLDGQETSRLFLLGDKLISWPVDGIRRTGGGPLERSTMFLSEIVARPGGLELVYEDEASAASSARVLAYQVERALVDA